jgi:hypothetical protein
VRPVKLAEPVARIHSEDLSPSNSTHCYVRQRQRDYGFLEIR